jgi:steroid delta-isomerase-like uncharacterized protein
MSAEAAELIGRYYAAFNAGDAAGMLDCLTEDMRHDPNQGEPRHGKTLFAAFLAHMDRCYAERLEDVVVMTEPTGTQAAGTFTVHGTYKATDDGLPEARGQTYVLPAGTFFSIRDGLISRVATSYNLPDWIRQVSA